MNLRDRPNWHRHVVQRAVQALSVHHLAGDSHRATRRARSHARRMGGAGPLPLEVIAPLTTTRNSFGLPVLNLPDHRISSMEEETGQRRPGQGRAPIIPRQDTPTLPVISQLPTMTPGGQTVNQPPQRGWPGMPASLSEPVRPPVQTPVPFQGTAPPSIRLQPAPNILPALAPTPTPPLPAPTPPQPSLAETPLEPHPLPRPYQPEPNVIPEPFRTPSTSAPTPRGRDDNCAICSDASREVVFIPCGHLIACNECAKKINFCPICRQGIRGCVRTFLA